jgi:hypothetical protein
MNDRPFLGVVSIGPDSYQLIYDRMMVEKPTETAAK